jgi:hypothetical protein
MQSPGYSGTPLEKELGIVAGIHVVTISAPENYAELLSPVPIGVRFAKYVSPATGLVHLFATRRAVLSKQLALLRSSIEGSCVIWVSWPKRSSKVPTDITDQTIREVALPLGLVDIKVCAVDEVWSGLRLVIRKELR